MSIELITALMFVFLVVLLVSGMPIAFCLGAVAIVFSILLWGPESLGILADTTAYFMKNFILIAIPLFCFMAYMLESSGIAEDLFHMMHVWLGPLRGGLAVGTVFVCTIFAAMSGISAAGTLTMGLVALPAMLKRGYDKHLACGAICAGGALGALIPPSVPFIVYALMAQASVGRLFLGGVLPGLLFSALFIIYIIIRCALNPRLGPPLPKSEIPELATRVKSLRAVILPIILVMAVLGSIFVGIATPTEAAGVGALGAIVCAAVYRKLSWPKVKEAAYNSGTVTAMIMWIIGAAATFASIYTGLGATDFIRDTMEAMPVNRWFIIIGMQLSLFILGCFLDPNGIMLITLPIYVPIIQTLGFDIVWFGVLFVMNMEMGYLTPPFGFNLFYLKGVAPKEVTMRDIYGSVWPFVGLQAMGLAIVMVFPAIALYLPNLVLG